MSPKNQNNIPDELSEKELTIGGATVKLSDLMRKVYVVCVEDTDGKYFDNSTEAKAFAAANGGEVLVFKITVTPKKAFWDFWREHKKEMQAQGVFVTKDGARFAVSTTKPTRRDIIRGKGYGGEYHAPEWSKHEMIDRDADAGLDNE